jgi:hypothetical protein
MTDEPVGQIVHGLLGWMLEPSPGSGSLMHSTIDNYLGGTLKNNKAWQECMAAKTKNEAVAVNREVLESLLLELPGKSRCAAWFLWLRLHVSRTSHD